LRHTLTKAFAEAGLKTRGHACVLLASLLAVLCGGSTVNTSTTTAAEHAQTTRVQGVVLYHHTALGLFVQVGGETQRTKT